MSPKRRSGSPVSSSAGEGGLYASVTLPNVMVGTVGGGTVLPWQRACLDIMRVGGPRVRHGHLRRWRRLSLAGELSITGALAAGTSAGPTASPAAKRTAGSTDARAGRLSARALPPVRSCAAGRRLQPLRRLFLLACCADEPGVAPAERPRGRLRTSPVFFLQLRIADEFKDFAEDSRFRPYRPVPRGLVTLTELGWVGVTWRRRPAGAGTLAVARGSPCCSCRHGSGSG